MVFRENTGAKETQVNVKIKRMAPLLRWSSRVLVFWGLLVALLGAQVPENIVRVEILPETDRLVVGGSSRLAIRLHIAPGWHINSNVPPDEMLVPTELELSADPGVTFGQLHFPEAEQKSFAFSETPLAVFEGTVTVFGSLSLPPDFTGDVVHLTVRLRFQACNDQLCLPPRQVIQQIDLPVAAAGEAVQPIHGAVFQQASEAGAPPEGKAAESQLAQTIEKQGMLVAFLVIFLSGLALNLTPCVYPLIPITISYFGGQVGGKKGSLLIYALLYVLGMGITYSTLGVVAALTGSMLGSWLQNPVVLVFIALVMVGLALSMFGLYEIRVPTRLSSFAGQSKGGYLGSLFMGLTVGIVAAPCIGPFVLALLTYVGEKGDPVLGFWMFFVLSLGLGLPYLFLGVFSGSVNRLPRSGAWMIWVRKIFGFLLLAVAVYFLSPLMHNDLWYFSLLAVVFLVGGIYLAWVDPNQAPGRGFSLVRNLVGIAFLLLSVYFWTSSVEGYVNERVTQLTSRLQEGGAAVEAIAWQPYSPAHLERARNEGKPVFIDFFADWCLPCKELDKFTFTDAQVIQQSRRFLMLKADLTRFDSPEVKALREQYRIRGVPTLVMLDPTGKEIPGTRVVGFVEPEVLYQAMQKALQTAGGTR